MGASKRKKVVIDYFNTLGIGKIDDVEKAFVKAMGLEAAKPIIEKWERLNPAQMDTGAMNQAGLHTEKERSIDQTELYDFMNQSFTSSMIFSSATDADIYFKTCNWINDNRSAFAGEILDIGCGTGIVTCFIATLFPESKVTGVDRSKNSIAIANELKERLGLENVTFIYDTLDDYNGGKFNTVFSSRTVHENIGAKLTSYGYMLFKEQIKKYFELYFEYAGIISQRIAEGGRFVSVERFESCDTDYYGFLKALNDNELKIDFGYHRIIEAKESNLVSKSKFTITVAEKGKGWTDEELFNHWAQFAFVNTRDLSQYTKPQVDYYIQENAGNVRFGYISYDTTPAAQSIRCVVYDLKNDRSCFLMHQENNLMSRLNIYDNSDETEARMLFANNKAQDKRNGFTVVDIEPGSNY